LRWTLTQNRIDGSFSTKAIQKTLCPADSDYFRVETFTLTATDECLPSAAFTTNVYFVLLVQTAIFFYNDE
jgi:hypothetical protein